MTKAPFSPQVLIDEYVKEDFSHHPHLSNRDQLSYLTNCMSTVYNRQHALVCIDVEAWERDNNRITEIGVAIYDPYGQEYALVPNIKQMHIRVQESLWRRNGRFVPDHADYSNSGVSHSLTEADSVTMLQKLADDYFNNPPAGTSVASLVGHNVKGDIKWLEKIGVRFNSKTELIDTEKLFSISNGKQGASLINGLEKLEIPHAFLHNAGNDSYYTLLLAMKLCDPNARRFYDLDFLKNREFIFPVVRGKKSRSKRDPNRARLQENQFKELLAYSERPAPLQK